MFVSGSADKTARFWDLRASTAITVVPSSTGMNISHLYFLDYNGSNIWKNVARITSQGKLIHS